MSRLSIKYGLLMAVSFTVFFLIMHAFGLSEEYYLRILNGIIHVGFLYALVRQWQERKGRPKKQYLGNVVQGLVASGIGAGLFAIFIAVFLSMNTEFMQTLSESTPLTRYITPVSAAMFIFVEGVAVGLIATYIMTRIVDYQLKIAQ